MIVQIGKNGSSWVEQNSAWRSRMETHHLYVVACRCYSCACKYVELGVYWDSPWTAVWIWYVMFFSFGDLYQILLIMCLHHSLSWNQHACSCIISHTHSLAHSNATKQRLEKPYSSDYYCSQFSHFKHNIKFLLHSSLWFLPFYHKTHASVTCILKYNLAVRVGLIYLVSGFGGSIFSSLFIQRNISVGASGALFGLLGAMLSELLTNWTIYSNKVCCQLLVSFAYI